MIPEPKAAATADIPMSDDQGGDADYTIAVLIPCYNEEQAIVQVVHDFRAALPAARIYVYDNNSIDRTVEKALGEGIVVRGEPRQGKGNVVRRMFADVEADIYVLVDGDGTYDAAGASLMVETLLNERLDMVVGARTSGSDVGAFRYGHLLGNRLLTYFVGDLFGREFADALSGYRVLSRRFVKSFPALAQGFETEIELTVHALALRMPIKDMETEYKNRPAGSQSKLRTYRDGLYILFAIIRLFKSERPLSFFFLLFMVLAATSVALAIPILLTYLETGLVPRLPTAVLSTGIMLLAFLSLFSGLVLDNVTLGRREVKRMIYLAIPPPGERD